ncbi:MAG: sigma-70 family RNA polymerase sigma factor [Nitriliruptorales bacterium]|nr:sigma-70 family RNA polymerase sigma factor [Nitriliruptorales bacterium]
MEGLTDEQLLALWANTEAARDRREQAFRELVDRYERRVWAICRRIVGSDADAEEATQDTFIRIARSGATFRGDSKLSTWIHRVATSACQDLLRKRARRPQTPVEDIAMVAAAAGLDEAPDDSGSSAAVDAVARALASLDDVSRSIVVLCAIEGFEYREAADALSMPVGTVKSRLFRARAHLADLLADEIGREHLGPTRRPT